MNSKYNYTWATKPMYISYQLIWYEVNVKYVLIKLKIVLIRILLYILFIRMR